VFHTSQLIGWEDRVSSVRSVTWYCDGIGAWMWSAVELALYWDVWYASTLRLWSAWLLFVD